MSRISLPHHTSLQDRIARLDGSREDFDPIVTLTDLASPAMQFVRIAALPKDSKVRSSLFPFIRGLWSLQSPWAMLAIGRPGDTQLYVGSPASDIQWPSVLQSSLPGGEVVKVPDPDELIRTMSSFSSVGVITGNPCLETKADQPLPSPVELLAGSLPNALWAFVIFAQPVSEGLVRQSLRLLHRDHGEIASNYQRPASAENGKFPAAQHLINLLRAAENQHELGSQVGMWKLAAGIMSTNDGDLATAAHAAFGALAHGQSAPQPMRCVRVGSSSPCALTLLNSQEAAAYAALPRIELPGLRAIDPVRFSVNPPQTHSENRIALGVILDQRRRTSNWFEVDRDDLPRHSAIFGTTGSGKTRTAASILVQLWIEHRIPFLMIEAAMKSEYRALLSSECGQDLRIYTPGRPDVSPFFLNPLERPAHVSIETHVDSLVGLFSAAMGLFPPMPQVLRLGLQQLFQTAEYPTLRDLQTVVRETIVRLGYQGEVGANIRAALDLRLQVMNSGIVGQTFNVQASTPVDDWATRPTIIELASLGDDTTRALMMGALLLRLVQTRQAQGLTSQLRHVVAIEEAHRLLRRQAPRGEVTDAGEHAAESFAQLLAEVRAFGQSLMVIDQSPSKLIPDVIRNAQLKIVHRLTSSDDQSAIGASMGLNESQQQSLAALDVGEAIAFSPRSTEPCKIIVPDRFRTTREQCHIPMNDTQIAAVMRPLLPAAQQVGVSPMQDALPAGDADTQDTHSPGSQTFPAVQPPKCPGCDKGDCLDRRRIIQHLLSVDHTSEFAAAVAAGWNGLWVFGKKCANMIWRDEMPPANAPYCIIMNIAALAGYDAQTCRKLRRNLAALRDHSMEQKR